MIWQGIAAMLFIIFCSANQIIDKKIETLTGQELLTKEKLYSKIFNVNVVMQIITTVVMIVLLILFGF